MNPAIPLSFSGDPDARKSLNFLEIPPTDPSFLFELYRSNYATDLLVASVVHFQLFQRIADTSLTLTDLQHALGFTERAATVLVTALRALGLLHLESTGRILLPDPVRHHLLPQHPFYIGDYFSLGADAPSVAALVERFRTGRPAAKTSHGSGSAFIYREGMDSAMEVAESARSLTLALAGRARNVAPHLASLLQFDMGETLLDVGAGSGLYSLALLQANPGLRVVALDRPEVLKVVEEFAAAGGVLDRLTLLPGDMFEVAWPRVDAVLFSNILHDWDVPECKSLIRRCASALRPNGRVLVHDAFLDDDLGGSLAVALYSIALFTLTEGRAYSRGEVAAWLEEAGFQAGIVEPTSVRAGLLTARPIRR